MTTSLPVKMPPPKGQEPEPPSQVAEWLRSLVFFLVSFGAVFLGVMVMFDLFVS